MVRTTPAIARQTELAVSLARQIEGGAPISYGRYLSWRGILPVEPPRRPEPARTSSSAAGRSVPWKFGFEGSRSTDGTVHLPPLPDDAVHQPMADARGTVTTFTIDRLSYTPSPPMVFAVVDFDGRRSAARRVDRRRRGGGPGRRRRRDDLPAAVHRRRDPQLLLEGTTVPERRRLMGSHGIKDKVAIVGMACTKFGEHWDLGVDELVLQAAEGAFDSAGVSRDGRRRLLAGHGPIGHERPPRLPSAAGERQAGHPGGELLRVRVGGLAPGGLRRLERCLRRGHGDRGREVEGLGLPGRQRLPGAERRNEPHCHRRRHVLHDRPRLREAVSASASTRSSRHWPGSPRRTMRTARAIPGRSSARR